MSNLNYLSEDAAHKCKERLTNKKINESKASCAAKGDRCIHFTLSYEFVWKLMWESRCFYCLREPTPPFYGDKNKPRANPLGMDRLDSDRSYTQLNTVPCCSICNYSKSDQGLKGLLEWLQRIRPNPHQSNYQHVYDPTMLEDIRFKALYRSKKREAAERGKEWTLTPQEALKWFFSPCYYCLAPAKSSNCYNYGKNEPLYYNGIDRVNNAVGYLNTNTVSCCKYCNRAKRDNPDFWFGIWAMQMQGNLPYLVKRLKEKGLV